MAGRIKIRAQKKGDVTEVKALMRHPMETGMRKDQAGDAIPAHFITEVAVFHGDQPVMQGLGRVRDRVGRVRGHGIAGFFDIGRGKAEEANDSKDEQPCSDQDEVSKGAHVVRLLNVIGTISIYARRS